MAKLPGIDFSQAQLQVSRRNLPSIQASGQAFGSVADVSSRLSQQKFEAQAREQETEAIAKLSELELQEQQRMEALKIERQNNPNGFTKDYLESFDKQYEKTIPKNASAFQRELYQNKKLDIRNSVARRAMSFEADRKVAVQRERIALAEQNYVNMVQQDPARVNEIIGRVNNIYDDAQAQAVIPNAEVAKQNAIKRIHGSVIDSYLNDERVGDAQTYLKNNAEAFGDEYSSFKKQILDARKAQKARLRSEYQPVINDALSEVRATGETDIMPGKKELDRVFGEEKSGEIWEQYRRDKAFGQNFQRIKTLPRNEIAQIIQDAQPSGENFQEEARNYQALIQAAQARENALINDPVDYVVQNDRATSELYKSYQNSDEQSRQKYLDAAINSTIERQVEYGVPEYATRILSNDMTQSIMSELDNVQTERRLEYTRGLQQQYGKYWPKVYNELVNAGLDDTTATLLKMDKLTQRRAAGLLADALEMGDSLKKTIDPEKLKQLPEQIYSELSDYTQTVIAQPNGAREVERIYAGTEALAMAYMSRGETAQSAATKAVNDIINKKYSITGRVRVPIDYDQASVEEGMAFVRDFVSKDEFVDPMIIGSIADIPEDIIRQQFMDEISTNAYFVTSPDDSGVYLIMNDRNIVTNMNGEIKPVFVKFEELQRLGSRGAERKFKGEGFGSMPLTITP